MAEKRKPLRIKDCDTTDFTLEQALSSNWGTAPRGSTVTATSISTLWSAVATARKAKGDKVGAGRARLNAKALA